MGQVIWTENARQDADDIGAYLASFSERQAERTFRRFFEIDKPQHRELLEGNYRLMYELLDADIILIQRVIHQARAFEP
jgi:toxin ParE1/3/4